MVPLTWGIFGLGAALSLAWLWFLIFGNKSAPQGNDPQTLEFKGLKIGLGSSVWVMTLFVSLAALPLALPAVRPTPQPAPEVAAVKCPEPAKSPERVEFHVSGTVLGCDGKVLGGAEVKALDSKNTEIFKTTVDESGSYAFATSLRLGDNSDSLTIQTKKDNYRPQNIVLFANAMNFQPVLASGAP